MADGITEICNRALSQIAETNQIESFSDPSFEAQQCALWYDKMRQRLLRAAPWGFARVQGNLTQVGDLYPDNTSPYPFLWSYAYPSDCLKFRYILAQPCPAPTNNVAPPLTGDAWVSPSYPYGPSRSNRFLVHNQQVSGQTSRVLVSNVPQAMGVYTKDEQNPDIFDVLFSDALEAALSYKLCVPLSGNIAMQANFKAVAEQALLQARAVDGNEAIPSSDVRVDWIEARGSGGAYGAFGTVPWGGTAGWGSWYGGYDAMNWGM